MSEIRRFDDDGAAARAAATYILGELSAAREARGEASLAVSGGSTPRKMFAVMAAADFDWRAIKLFFVDERMVGPEHEDSNYRMAREALIEPAGLAESQVFRIHGELEPPAAAARYVEELRRQFRLGEGELPVFDVIHLGMGDDAHTASLFPGEPLIHDRKGLAASVYATAKKTYRVTLLPGVLLKARTTVFLVAGKGKAKSLEAVREGASAVDMLPAQVVERHAPNVVWFADRAAAPE